MLAFLLIIFCFGMIFGSFSTVLIERWHSWKWGILMGRSECPKCHHILQATDLFPILSYVFYQWKCSHCKSKISPFYPIAEITMGTIFLLLAYASIQLGITPLSIELLFLLWLGFVTWVYVLYDIRYMEIPDQIMIPSIFILILIPFLSLLFIWYEPYSFHILPIPTIDRLLWAWLLYTFFYLQILLPGGYYLIKKMDWKNFRILIMGYVLFPISLFTEVFFTKKDETELDIPTWIWWWDLRIAIFIGLTLGIYHGIASFAIAYITGSIVWIWLLIYNAIRWKKTDSQIPFGPFLGLWWILSIIFYEQIINIYTIYFI